MFSNLLIELENLREERSTKAVYFWLIQNYHRLSEDELKYLESVDWFVESLKMRLGYIDYD